MRHRRYSKSSSTLGPPPTLDKVSVRLRYFSNTDPEINLLLVPGDFDLVKYSMIGDVKVLEPVKTRFLKFIEKAREERDLVCIDCNPSSSFMTICALQAATHVLVPVRPDRYSIEESGRWRSRFRSEADQDSGGKPITHSGAKPISDSGLKAISNRPPAEW